MLEGAAIRKILHIYLLLQFILIMGCVSNAYRQFYHQIAPSQYEDTKNYYVFEYSNVDIDEIYSLLFKDFLIIGESRFTGLYSKATQASLLASEIGSDVLIASTQFKETRTSFKSLSTHTAYMTATTIVPVEVDRYKHKAIFLKNINNIVPLWETKRKDFPVTSESQFDGIWKNIKYEVEIIKSGDDLVAFIDKRPSKRSKWKPDDTKFIFNPENNVGIYLKHDRTPIPASFKINQFGHLEITLFTNQERFSFERVNYN